MSSSYQDLVNVASFWKKRENFDPERGELTHYCRDCTRIVTVEMIDEELAQYRCNICQGTRVASWSKESIVTHYKIK